MASRDRQWETVRSLEDALALLHTVNERRRIVRLHLWYGGDQEMAYTEITAMKDDLEKLKAFLSDQWAVMIEFARTLDQQ
jgi:hypothetical protein